MNEKAREYSWKSKGIKITTEEYNDKMFGQEGRCAICGRHQSELTIRLSVDHNHATGQVRGLLCFPCNTLVGRLEDNNFLQKIEIYLSYWDCKEFKQT